MTFSQRLPQSFYRKVQERVREKLVEDGLDAILIDEWHDVAYLTGFFHSPTERPCAVWISADRSVLLVPALDRDYAYAQDATVDEVAVFDEYPGLESPYEALARLVGRSGRWGHSPKLSTGRLSLLSEVFDSVSWQMSPLVDTLRLIKHPEEIELHRKAGELGDRMLTAGRELIEDALRSGTELPTESELFEHTVRVGTNWMYDNHSGVVVVPWLAGGLLYAGENTAHPHAFPSSYRVKQGDILILSLGGAVGGRYCESERTFFIGEPTPEQRRYFEVVREAQAVGGRAIREGGVASEISKTCLSVIHEAGLGKYLLTRQGHGMGVDFHEPPWLADGDDTVLQAGMIVSNEPGIYVPGHGGYRLSDTTLVTSDGSDSLTKYPRDLDDIVIAV